MRAIRFIGRLRKYLSKDHLKMMVQCFFLCRAWIIVKVFFCGLLKREIDHRYPKLTSENRCCVTEIL